MSKPISSDPSIYVLPDRLISLLTRSTVALLPIATLFIPLVVVLNLDAMKARLAAILLALAVFIIMLSTFAQLRTGELFIAGVTSVGLFFSFLELYIDS